MTQKIFDIENEEDMALLWSILTDTIKIIKRPYKSGMVHPFSASVDTLYLGDDVIKINWHDKTEITRPKNWESMIGCVGWFSSHKDAKKDDMIFGLLDKYNKKDNLGRCFYCHCDTWYKYFFPAKKCDVKFYGVDEDE